MEFKSILFADTGMEVEKAMPAFFQDLQLDYITGIINNLTGDYQASQYYYTFPSDLELVKYRQQVFKDLENKGLQQAVKGFCVKMQKSRHSYLLSLECEDNTRAAGYHLEAALLYWEALEGFGQYLGDFTPVSDGINSLREYVLKHIKECVESGFSKAATGAREIFSQMRFYMAVNGSGITITGREDAGTAGGSAEKNYLEELAGLLGVNGNNIEEMVTLKDIFPNVMELSYLENALVKLLKRSSPEVFSEIEGFYKNYPDFYSKELLQFEEEVQFYLGFLSFRDRTVSHGYNLDMPDVISGGDFSGNGIYDIALAWKSADRNYKVVPNDFSFNTEPSFFVVTGPNQGGKTTFARSMGQAVYFSIMGLPANALSLTVPLFKGIMTHFEAEEKIQSNSGKLKEEIDRLAPMMKQDNGYQFVILNELFTTATTNDAFVMGREVMEHFLGKDCYGIYVTHIQELAEETDRIISLVAQAGDGADRVRTYKMVRMEAQGYGYSESLVKKFGLAYEDILRRLD